MHHLYGRKRCKWRALPKKFGNWHTIYMKFSRWAKNGIIQSIFDELQKQKFIDIQSEALCLDDTSIKGYPNASVARKISNEKYWSLKKGRNNEDTRSLCIWKICLENSTFSRKPSRCTRRTKTYRVVQL